MERRSASRYPLDAAALVMRTGAERPGGEHEEAPVRDMSSRGMSFFSEAVWPEGSAITILVQFDREGLQPYSYNLMVPGSIVRQGMDEEAGKPYYAVHFTKKPEVVEWEEKPGGSPSNEEDRSEDQ